MTTPATISNPNGSTTAQTIRTARAEAANDIAKSRLRLAKNLADARAESRQLADLIMIGEVVGVTDVDVPSAAIVDPAVTGEAVRTEGGK